MPGFDTLQSVFVGQEFSAFGLSSQSTQILQPPAVLSADGGDAALWAWFNAVPQAGPIYAPSSSDFFTAYSAVIGALLPSGSALDPVAAAKKRLAAWGSAPPTWSQGCASLDRMLSAAPSTAFKVTAPASATPAFWNLVGGPPPPTQDLGDIFASGEVQARVRCAHLLAFTPQPGDWYVSSALSLAYRCPGAAPWDPASPVTWQSTFGPEGTLQRILAALIVVSGLDASAGSTAPFDAADQALVIDGAKARGIWPYYLPATGAATTTSFDENGCLSLSVTSQPKTAVALAAVVQSVSSYLGI